MFAPNPYSKAQIQHLAPLIPSNVPIRPDILPELVEALDFCRRGWVFDFLFSTGSSHLTFLTSPLFKQDAFSCTTSMYHFEPPLKASTPYSISIKSSTVFVPAFEVQGYSLGFTIEERELAYTNSKTGSRKTKKVGLAQGRYIGHIETGHLIVVDVREDMVMMESIRHLTTTTRRRTRINFDKSILAILSNAHQPLDIAKVLAAIKMCTAIREFRPCQRCGLRPGMSCTCKGPVCPGPPLAGQPRTQSLCSHLGAFEGILHESVFRKGVAMQQRVLFNQVCIEGQSAPAVIHRLTEWAVKENLLRVEVHPWTSVKQFADEHGSRSSSENSSYKTKAPDQIENGSWNAWDNDRYDGVTGWSGSAKQEDRIVDKPCDAVRSDANGKKRKAADMDRSESEVEAKRLATGSVSRELQLAYGQSFVASNGRNAQTASRSARSHQTHDSNLDGKAGEEMNGQESKRENRQDMHSEAGRTGAKAYRKSRKPINVDDIDSEDEKRIVAMEEARMARNRESAKRSNMKRKTEHEERKKELEGLKIREKELREREMKLRKENLFLKSVHDRVGMHSPGAL